VGWRDRDWAKFDDGEWSTLVHAPAPVRRRPSRPVAVASSSVFLAVAASAAATFLLHLGHADKLPAVRTTPSNVLTVHWRTQDLAPASTAGRVCLTSTRHGRICASYAIGEKPADALTRRLEAAGFEVRSSG
jgi:hypothetical protein